MEELIERIMASAKEKTIKSLCRKILKKCSFRSKNDLSNVTLLATRLYACGYEDDAAAVCDLLSGITFSGNYDIWDRADYAACLKARILREKGITEGYEELLKRVNEHRDPELYPNIAEYYRTTLNRNIESDDQAHPGKKGDFWRLNKLIHAVRYREAGGFPIPDEELETDIRELKDTLKEIS